MARATVLSLPPTLPLGRGCTTGVVGGAGVDVGSGVLVGVGVGSGVGVGTGVGVGGVVVDVGLGVEVGVGGGVDVLVGAGVTVGVGGGVGVAVGMRVGVGVGVGDAQATSASARTATRRGATWRPLICVHLPGPPQALTALADTMRARDARAHTTEKSWNWSDTRPHSTPLMASHPRTKLMATPMSIRAWVSHTQRFNTLHPLRTTGAAGPLVLYSQDSIE